jgi:hypothetical protein
MVSYLKNHWQMDAGVAQSIPEFKDIMNLLAALCEVRGCRRPGIPTFLAPVDTEVLANVFRFLCTPYAHVGIPRPHRMALEPEKAWECQNTACGTVERR